MKYLIFAILFINSFALAGEINDSLKMEFDINQLKNSNPKTIKFKNSNNILSDKYDCINLSNLINTNHNYTFELISNTGKVTFNTNYDIYQNTFFPTLIFNKNKTGPIYEMQFQENGNGTFDFDKLDRQLDSTVDNIIQIPHNTIEFENNTVIYIDDKNKMQIYPKIKKINIYQHI